VDVEFPSRGSSGWKAGDDPILVADAIEFAGRAEADFTAPLTISRRVIANDIEERFITETDPEGNPWEPWADSYRDRAAYENVGILEKTAEYHKDPGPSLRDAASDMDNLVMRTRGVSSAAIGGGDIAFIGSNLPDYWIYHQEGTSRMLARPFIGISDDAEEIIYSILDMHVGGTLAGATAKGQPIFRLPGTPATFGSTSVFGR
jgi:hypothetical protein